MPPATRTSVPAAAMISVADCWSRMLSRLVFVANGVARQRQDDEEERRTGSGSRALRSARPARRAARAASRGAPDACALTRSRAPPGRPRTRRARIALSVDLVARRARRRCRPRRITSTRCERPSTSSSSDEIRSDAEPVARRARPGSRRSRAWRRRRRRASARRRSARCGLAEQRAREQHLLLVAARERARPARRVARAAHVAAVEHGRGRPAARAGGARRRAC